MTLDQEHLITLLFVKYGGFTTLVDMWFMSDPRLSQVEQEAIKSWLDSSPVFTQNSIINITLETTNKD